MEIHVFLTKHHHRCRHAHVVMKHKGKGAKESLSFPDLVTRGGSTVPHSSNTKSSACDTPRLLVLLPTS